MWKNFLLYEEMRMFSHIISLIFSFESDLLETYRSFLTVHMKVFNFMHTYIFHHVTYNPIPTVPSFTFSPKISG
jgi:hypothetical protein